MDGTARRARKTGTGRHRAALGRHRAALDGLANTTAVRLITRRLEVRVLPTPRANHGSHAFSGSRMPIPVGCARAGPASFTARSGDHSASASALFLRLGSPLYRGPWVVAVLAVLAWALGIAGAALRSARPTRVRRRQDLYTTSQGGTVRGPEFPRGSTEASPGHGHQSLRLARRSHRR